MLFGFRKKARRPSPATPRLTFRPRLEGLEDRLTPSSGGLLDPTFGSGGAVLNDLGSTASKGLDAVTIQPDGKFLAVGFVGGGSASDFAAIRYNANGTLDAGFGSGGLTTTDFSRRADTAWAVASQPGSGGKYLVAGTATGTNGPSTFGVIRLNANGALDTTFGAKTSKGKVTANPGGQSNGYCYGMAVLPDGKFLLAGATQYSFTAEGWISLARFNANGTLDTSFGNQGTVLTTLKVLMTGGSSNHPGIHVAVDGSGRIVVAGNVTSPSHDVLVARFNPNGTLDTTFGAAHSGVVTTDINGSGDQAYGLVLQGDKILVGGYIGQGDGSVAALLVRYNADGSLDGTFGQGGITTAVADPTRQSFMFSSAMAVQPDGTILIAGDFNYGAGAYSLALMRFGAAGALDTSYGPSGTGAVITSLGSNDTRAAAAMALQADGRVVLVGQVISNISPYVQSFALVRFTGSSAAPSPVQVGSFAASATTVAAGSPVTLTAGGATTTNPGATITQVAFYATDSSGTEVFLGYATQGAGGTWALTCTVSLAPGSYTLLALAADSTGAVSDPFTLGLQVT
jgi:uncharacterized delta-60 repeat protein